MWGEHVHPFYWLLVTSLILIVLDKLRQHTLNSTSYRGKDLVVSYKWAKFSQTGQTKNWMRKRSCLFAQKTWMKILFQWWPAFIIFIFMILSQTWFQVSFLLFLQRKSRREVWEGCWILGLFWENFSGGSLRAGHRANWPAVNTTLPGCFTSQRTSFYYKERSKTVLSYNSALFLMSLIECKTYFAVQFPLYYTRHEIPSFVMC